MGVVWKKTTSRDRMDPICDELRRTPHLSNVEKGPDGPFPMAAAATCFGPCHIYT